VGVVIAAQTLAYDFSVSVPIGIAIVAAFLFCVAVMGLVGVLRHHQVVMFFVSFFCGWREKWAWFILSGSACVTYEFDLVVLA